MPLDPINTIGSNAQSAATLTPLPVKTLNQDDFLKLLVAQMSAQDPMNPQSNSDFAAQMAQFSALQTSRATQSDIAQLHADQQAVQANGLLGRSVTLLGSDGAIASGTISS